VDVIPMIPGSSVARCIGSVTAASFIMPVRTWHKRSCSYQANTPSNWTTRNRHWLEFWCFVQSIF